MGTNFCGWGNQTLTLFHKQVWQQEAELSHRDRVTHYVSKFMLFFTSYGSYKSFNQQK